MKLCRRHPRKHRHQACPGRLPAGPALSRRVPAKPALSRLVQSASACVTRKRKVDCLRLGARAGARPGGFLNGFFRAVADAEQGKRHGM